MQSRPDHLQQLRQAIAEVETARAEFKLASAQRKVTDPLVVACRNRLRDSFSNLIYLDVRYAVKHDLELSLWKSVFYPTIEGHRAQIAEAAKHRGRRRRQAEAEDSTQAFLDEAITFYTNHVRFLQNKYNLKHTVAEFVRMNRPDAVWGSENALTMTFEQLAILCCHRCFICLGDLARYREKLKSADEWGNAAQHDWTQMQTYYHKAIKILPLNGNPFNQFGVLALELAHQSNALYYFCRALAVAYPFNNAQINLRRLFQANATAFAKIFPELDTVEKARKAVKEDLAKFSSASREEKTARRPPFLGSSVAEVLVAFVRVHALLSMEGADADSQVVGAYTCAGVKRLLALESMDEGVLSNLMLCNIVAVHYNAITADGAKGDVTELFTTVQIDKPQVRRSLCFAVEFAAACMGGKRKHRKRLCSVSMFLSWLSVHARALEDLCATKTEIASRSSFLKAVCSFSNKLVQEANKRSMALPDPPAVESVGCVPEDVELLGFLPLAHVHAHLTPSVCSALTVVGAVDHLRYKQMRVERVRQACDVMCETSRGGQLVERMLLYSNPQSKLYATRPEGPKQRKSRRRKAYAVAKPLIASEKSSQLVMTAQDKSAQNHTHDNGDNESDYSGSSGDDEDYDHNTDHHDDQHDGSSQHSSYSSHSSTGSSLSQSDEDDGSSVFSSDEDDDAETQVQAKHANNNNRVNQAQARPEQARVNNTDAARTVEDLVSSLNLRPQQRSTVLPFASQGFNNSHNQPQGVHLLSPFHAEPNVYPTDAQQTSFFSAPGAQPFARNVPQHQQQQQSKFNAVGSKSHHFQPHQAPDSYSMRSGPFSWREPAQPTLNRPHT